MWHNLGNIVLDYYISLLSTIDIWRKIQASEAHYQPKVHLHFSTAFFHLLTTSKNISIG